MDTNDLHMWLLNDQREKMTRSISQNETPGIETYMSNDRNECRLYSMVTYVDVRWLMPNIAGSIFNHILRDIGPQVHGVYIPRIGELRFHQYSSFLYAPDTVREKQTLLEQCIVHYMGKLDTQKILQTERYVN